MSSEVATTMFLRMHGLPVPEVDHRCASSEFPVGVRTYDDGMVQGTDSQKTWGLMRPRKWKDGYCLKISGPEEKAV